MKDKHMQRRIIGIVALFVLFGVAPVHAFSSGSTGSLGALSPASNTVVTLPANGILNYTTVTIPVGVTVTFQRNAANTPVTLLAQGDISISGTISVDGSNAVPATGSGSSVLLGALGGPGGFSGGQGGLKSIATMNGTPGQGPGGGSGGYPPSVTTVDGSYGADSSFVSLIPLVGGSGGGGGSGDTTVWGAGGAGGGGGLVMASTTQITITGTGVVRANGGAANYTDTGSCNWFTGGAGSGGAMRLVSPQITHQGSLQAVGGDPGCTPVSLAVTTSWPGRIRIECTTCALGSGTINPAASTSTTLGPVAPASTPPLANVPTVRINTVGGLAAPATPGGTYTTADVALPGTAINPVAVTLTATNVPVGTMFLVKVIPQGAVEVPFTSAPSTGTFASSTAIVTVNLPYGQTSLLYAYASFTQVTTLFPLIDGEPVERVLLVAVYGEESSALFITQTGNVGWGGQM